MSFEQLGLQPAILARLSKLNFKEATPVQERAIPLVLQGKDVLAGAQTGTGKTAAYGLPIIQRLIENPKPLKDELVRGLVLVPTRELAQQVLDNLTDYAEELDIKVLAVYGGTSMRVQTDNLKGGVDILVATPEDFWIMSLRKISS